MPMLIGLSIIHRLFDLFATHIPSSNSKLGDYSESTDANWNAIWLIHAMNFHRVYQVSR
jgi:hypothetical protein